MKYVKECAVILGITLAGEWLNDVLPFPVPAGVYGLFLMLLLLCLGVLKLEQVEATGNFLLDIMPVLFVPAAVGLMESFEQLRPVLVPVAGVCAISTLVVMGVTGITAEAFIRKMDNRKNGNRHKE
ncbi:MAG: CidA/LrgA family protein [Lachnospiraceae bacterium]|nr:CidA/LrgA family protein [Lachnospiraceae bacterium]